MSAASDTNNAATAAGSRGEPAAVIRAVISDVDGTLVRSDKSLTQAAIEAVAALTQAGVLVALASSRPPRGMADLLQRLNLTTPFASFNGGSLCHPDMTVIEANRLDPDTARAALTWLEKHHIDAWVFAGNQWYLTNPAAHYVSLERHTVGFDATVVASFDGLPAIDKIVGTTTDEAALTTARDTLAKTLDGGASVELSQPYYLDITHPQANKRHALDGLSRLMGVPISQVAVLGDAGNDVPMLQAAGLAIAMGQAHAQVQAHAHFVTASNQDDGFAKAIERFVLPRVGR